MSMYYRNPYSLNHKSDCEGLPGNWGSGAMSVEQSLVLDCEKGELVKTLGKTGKKCGVSEPKTVAALKSHSEAERRRRERINAHLATLRGLVPGEEKMDKATLLAEVISQVKQLKKTAKQASEDLHIPTDSDEVKVEQLDDDAVDGSFSFRASICCYYRPDLLSDTRQCLNVLPVDLANVEISTLEGRVKIVFLLTGRRDNMNNSADARELIVSSIHGALSCVVDKSSESEELSQLTLPHKRQRVSYLDYP
ncbi:transcription factor bHLH30-like [Olea europaea subsp. europaea]|uniref:Transcription factor bHLH30-like n=1 Tax=Olea europaea subsp. europaea TaxID=158383 RepID=A0A8S0PS27_OLEEU|nr:transcription factor bHLH30-like [Olea europaea subsp. europaea]